MAHLHYQTWIQILTLIRIPNQMATLYYAEHFTLHGLGLRSLLPISVWDRNLGPSPYPESISGNVNEPLHVETPLTRTSAHCSVAFLCLLGAIF